jgi:hypothetical protein
VLVAEIQKSREKHDKPPQLESIFSKGSIFTHSETLNNQLSRNTQFTISKKKVHSYSKSFIELSKKI